MLKNQQKFPVTTGVKREDNLFLVEGPSLLGPDVYKWLEKFYLIYLLKLDSFEIYLYFCPNLDLSICSLSGGWKRWRVCQVGNLNAKTVLATMADGQREQTRDWRVSTPLPSDEKYGNKYDEKCENEYDEKYGNKSDEK